MGRLGKNKKRRGFTLVELLIVVAILGLLSAVALPGYREYVDEVDNSQAMADIVMIENAIERYFIDTNRNPPDLAAIDFDSFQDPWGNGRINPLGLRTSVGAGIRWRSPIGPLRFEWGFPLRPLDGERKQVFDFSIGSFF